MNNKKQKTISVHEAFNEVFGNEDKYFGEWFISTDDDFAEFLENYITKNENFFKQLRHLYLYFESLEILKKQAEDKNFTPAVLLSRDTWYCCVLLLLLGWIDQHTKNEVNFYGKIKKHKKRFQIVLNHLDEDKKRDFILHYNGSKSKMFNDVTSHLYSTRTFFAHDVILPNGSIPQDSYFGFHSEKIGTFFINMPHGRIFLMIVIALIRYIGFKGKMDILSNKKFDSFVDFMRKT